MVKGTWLLGGILVCTVLSDAGLAQAIGKFQKKEDAVVASQTALTQPAARLGKDKQRPDINQGDLFAGKGTQLQAVIESKIKVLKRLIELTADSDPEKPDLLFRMAELCAELMRIHNFRARELDEKIYAAHKAEPSKVSALEAEQKSLEKQEKDWLLEAVKHYLTVANQPKFQSYARLDEVLFYLAYLLTQVNKEEQARGYFQRLIKDHPQSAFLPHAYLSFGEYFFEKRDLENALRFFDGDRYRLGEFVIMPNHVHVLIELLSQHSLGSIVSSWKRFSARAANQVIGRSGPFWQDDYWDTYIRDERHFESTVGYIENNPVKAGLVGAAEDWPWSHIRRRSTRQT